MTYIKINLRLLIVFSIFIFSVIFSYKISKAEVSDSYILSKKEDSIYWTLIENGYSPAGACGILGNISIENPDFEADLYANHNTTYGLFQWSDVGNRKSNLVRWCNNRLLYPNRIDGQLAFAMHEINGGDPQASKLCDYLKHADTPENAAMEFAAGFERCVGETSNPDADGIYKGVVYPDCYGRVYQALSYRMINARKYYSAYCNENINSDAVIEIKAIPTAGIIAEREEKMEEKLITLIPKTETSNKGLLLVYRIVCIVTGYCFGCILGIQIIIQSTKQKKALHFQEKLPSLLTVLHYIGIKECILSTIIDVLKLYVALLVAYFITGGALGSEQILLVGIGVIIGNAFPFWRNFSGGMGLIVTTIFICTYMPIWGYLCCLLGLIVAIICKSLPFGAICISIFAVPYAFFLKGIEGGIFITLAMIIVLFKHYHFLKKFIGRELITKHYRRNKKIYLSKS